MMKVVESTFYYGYGSKYTQMKKKKE